MTKAHLILIPQGAIVPEELRITTAPKSDLIGAITAATDQPVIYAPSSRELQALVEYRDILNVDVTAVIGLSGSMYSTIWNTYVSTMRRTTVDQLLSDQSDANDVASDQGQKEETNPFLRRKAVSEVDVYKKTEVSATDDPETGDL